MVDPETLVVLAATCRERIRFHYRDLLRRVVFLVHTSAPQLIETFRVRPEEIEPIDDKTCLLRTSADALEWTAVRIVYLGLEFEVREPPEMAEMVADLGAKLLRAAGASRTRK